MHKILPLIFCLLAISTQAKIMPAEGAKLNYVLSGFMVDEKPGTAQYRLQIARGNYSDNKLFNKNVFIDKKLSSNRTIEELPDFGRQYTWRMSYLNAKGKETMASPLYHFATDSSDAVDTTMHRLRVIGNKLGNSEMMITTDFKAVIYNLQGKPLWYLPQIEKFGPRQVQLRDLKPTKWGTFTCLYGFHAIEIDYNGKIVWEAPDNGQISGDSNEFYHHELTRLDNGHYMVCGDEIWWAKPDSIAYGKRYMPKDIEVQAQKGQSYRRYVFGTLIEYDSVGNIVWYWKSRKHFIENEHVALGNKPRYTGFTHLNSFFFDEKDSIIYMSYRDINRVVKIRYPDGEWLNSYGSKISTDSTDPDCTYFCGQHCVRCLPNGNIYLFDNHTERGHEEKPISYIRIYKQPETDNKKENVTKTWSFACNIDSNASGGASTGGGVYM
ncbi:MAG: hypothetical protein EOP51_07530, partial [Sphingobacteriales bacterium]